MRLCLGPEIFDDRQHYADERADHDGHQRRLEQMLYALRKQVATAFHIVAVSDLKFPMLFSDTIRDTTRAGSDDPAR